MTSIFGSFIKLIDVATKLESSRNEIISLNIKKQSAIWILGDKYWQRIKNDTLEFYLANGTGECLSNDELKVIGTAVHPDLGKDEPDHSQSIKWEFFSEKIIKLCQIHIFVTDFAVIRNICSNRSQKPKHEIFVSHAVFANQIISASPAAKEDSKPDLSNVSEPVNNTAPPNPAFVASPKKVKAVMSAANTELRGKVLTPANRNWSRAGFWNLTTLSNRLHGQKPEYFKKMRVSRKTIYNILCHYKDQLIKPPTLL